MIKVCVLSSGSKGNSILVEGPEHSVLFDNGLSGKQLENRIEAAGLNKEKISAIFVSHEHSDHIRGVGILSRRFKIPVFIDNLTYDRCGHRLGKLFEAKLFNVGDNLEHIDFHISSFPISHDAINPSGFTITNNGKKIGIVTDLGCATHIVRERLKGCHTLVVESNHDYKMLIEGPYTWELKQRIRSNKGHLSNQDSGELISCLLHDNLKYIFLAHLSEENNLPEIALQNAKKIVNKANFANIEVINTSQEMPSEVVCI